MLVVFNAQYKLFLLLLLQDGELPDDVDWNFLFRIQNGEVYRVCPPVDPEYKKKRFHMNKVCCLKNSYFFKLSK